jgi:hypothetical protein
VKLLAHLFWAAVAGAAAFCLGAIALYRGEHINSIWLVLAAACSYATGYRFYSRFLAARVLALDDRRATPAERLRDGQDFEPTNKWILFGHHFAAIAGPGPLVGPVLAAQFGYLPGTLWIIIGAVLGGAAQDFVILFASMRRDGKSLGQMARDEIGKVAGFTALITVLLIMIIMLAVMALVVVNALKGSPWGAFTIAATIPIAVFMGLYLRYWRPAKVLECSAIGVVLVMAAIFAGRSVAQSATLAPLFTLSAMALAIAIIVYGFLASALPVWLLLAPRGYLSTFVKLGVILMLGVGILFVRPELQLPALTRFVDGTGPIFAGKIFPFCFITIACGSISGFHALIASGTTPKMIAKEGNARPVGHDCGLRAPAGRVLRRELAPGSGRRDARRGGGDDFVVGLPGDSGGHDQSGARCRRADPVLSHRRRSFAGIGDGPHLRARRRRTGGDRLLVSLRHHVRSALHPDHPRPRHARRPLHAARLPGTRLEASGAHGLDAGRHGHQCGDRGGVGLLSDSGRARPAGRNQFAVAAVRDRQPVAGRHRAVGGHHHPAQDARREIPVGHLRAAGLAAHRDVHGRVAEDLLSRSGDRFSGAGGPAGSILARRHGG